MKHDSPITKTLAEHGYKLTGPRLALATALEKRRGIFSAHDCIKKFPRMDKVSIYRTLELFASLDVIHPVITLDGAQYYELHGNTHHHHIVCTQCHRSACVDCHVPSVTVRGFTNTHHALVITAYCTACSKKRCRSRS